MGANHSSERTESTVQRQMYYRQSTVKPLNFAHAGDLISLVLQMIKIRKIKYLWKFKPYIDGNSKLPDSQNYVPAKMAAIFNLQN